MGCSPPTRCRSIGEAIGMTLPGSASPPAVDRRREDDARDAGAAVVNLLRLGIAPRMIMTKQAFENAIAVTTALGGSTNAVLHLLAIANEAGVALELDDFNRIAAKVPHIADMKPGGKFHMTDLDRIGGVPVVLKLLLDAGLLHGDVPHRHRQDDGREPGCDRSAGSRRGRRSPARRPDPCRGRDRRPARHARPERSGGQGRRAERGADARSRASLACSTARTGRWRRSSPARSSRGP